MDINFEKQFFSIDAQETKQILMQLCPYYYFLKMGCLGVVSVEEMVSHKRLRLYGHVERKEKSYRVSSAFRKLQVDGTKGKD